MTIKTYVRRIHILMPRFMEVKCHDNKQTHSLRLTATQRLKLLLSVILWRFSWYLCVIIVYTIQIRLVFILSYVLLLWGEKEKVDICFTFQGLLKYLMIFRKTIDLIRLISNLRHRKLKTKLLKAFKIQGTWLDLNASKGQWVSQSNSIAIHNV